MKRQELIEVIAREASTSKAAVGRVLDAFTNQVLRAVRQGQRVKLSGLGIFEGVEVPGRKVRHPKTGESMDVPSKRKARFIAGATFKAALGDEHE